MSNEHDDLDLTGGSGPEWTKEEAGRDRHFDFAAFLGPQSLEEQVTDALDGKDLLDKDAYGTYPPGYIPRRSAPGEHGRHEAPEPDPEPEFPGDPPTQRFSQDEMENLQPPEPEPDPDPLPVIKDAPPPRPKVVVAEPAPRVYVTPEMEYDDTVQEKRSAGKGLKFAIALLITVAVVLAVAAVGLSLFRSGGLSGLIGTTSPAPSPTDYLFGGMPTRSPSTPAPPAATAPPAPTDTPQPTPPPVVYHTITVTAGTGGSISPSGAVQVQEGDSVTFAITPYDGYELSQLLINGESTALTGSYTFSNVRGDCSIYAVFQAVVPTAPPATEIPVATDEPIVPDVPPVSEEPAIPPAVDENGYETDE